MIIRQFEANGRTLLLSMHRAQRLRARSAAVLLCNPFGEEAARAHRTYRVLATRLRQAGYPTLRFDYAGTGDSSGDSAGFGIEHWLDDIVACADELRRESGATRVVLLGLRLGATLAALASTRRALRPRHLLLWDPVVDGAGYLRELGAAHRAYMRAEMGENGWTDRLPVEPASAPTEALGSPIPPALAAQLAAIDLGQELPQADHLTVLGGRHAASLARLRERLPSTPALRWLEATDSAVWNSDAALNAAVVPADEIGALVARIEEVSP
jgi:pimeloyl-ACP methyl ester carboxylesterase